jgi:hypothetical protein
MSQLDRGNRMSAPSGPPLKVRICSECGERVPDASTGHSHGDTYPRAEEVEVIPVAKAEELATALETARDALDAWELSSKESDERVRVKLFDAAPVVRAALTDWASKEDR